jgi:hypothetical protein
MDPDPLIEPAERHLVRESPGFSPFPVSRAEGLLGLEVIRLAAPGA